MQFASLTLHLPHQPTASLASVDSSGQKLAAATTCGVVTLSRLRLSRELLIAAAPIPSASHTVCEARQTGLIEGG